MSFLKQAKSFPIYSEKKSLRVCMNYDVILEYFFDYFFLSVDGNL